MLPVVTANRDDPAQARPGLMGAGNFGGGFKVLVQSSPT
jgi:hypothetical protein